MTSISYQLPFPANESYAMQQAWRTMYDKSSVSPDEYYAINRDYPAELGELCRRYYKATDINYKIKPLIPAQQTYVNNMFDNMNDPVNKFYDAHPKLAVTGACVCVVGFTGAVIFFLSSIPIYLAVGILTISVVAIAAAAGLI